MSPIVRVGFGLLLVCGASLVELEVVVVGRVAARVRAAVEAEHQEDVPALHVGVGRDPAVVGLAGRVAAVGGRTQRRRRPPCCSSRRRCRPHRSGCCCRRTWSATGSSCCRSRPSHPASGWTSPHRRRGTWFPSISKSPPSRARRQRVERHEVQRQQRRDQDRERLRHTVLGHRPEHLEAPLVRNETAPRSVSPVAPRDRRSVIPDARGDRHIPVAARSPPSICAPLSPEDALAQSDGLLDVGSSHLPQLATSWSAIVRNARPDFTPSAHQVVTKSDQGRPAKTSRLSRPSRPACASGFRPR